MTQYRKKRSPGINLCPATVDIILKNMFFQHFIGMFFSKGIGLVPLCFGPLKMTHQNKIIVKKKIFLCTNNCLFQKQNIFLFYLLSSSPSSGMYFPAIDAASENPFKIFSPFLHFQNKYHS